MGVYITSIFYWAIMKSSRGFTIWELIVVMSIVAILTSLLIPGYTARTQQRRSEVIAAQIQDVIQYARGEAMRRGTTVIICGANYRVNDSLHGCQGSGNKSDWSEGILAYVDESANSQYSSGERVKAMRFDTDVVSPATVTLPIGILSIKPDSTLFSSDNASNWTFTLTQVINSSVKESKLKVNLYGYSSFCRVGEDSAC